MSNPNVRQLIQTISNRGLAAFAQLFSENSPNFLRVLMYHRVDEADHRQHLDPCTLSATPDGFLEQITYLKANHSVVSIHDVQAAIENKRKLPRRAVLITFDDAYDCFEKHAWPVLRQSGLPATLFIPTHFPGNRRSRFWWDTLYETIFFASSPELNTPLGRLPVQNKSQRTETHRLLTREYINSTAAEATELIASLLQKNDVRSRENNIMTWDGIRKLVAQGLDLGAHTQTHPLLGQMKHAMATREIVESIDEIQTQTGYKSNAFAYPGGSFNRETIEICKIAGCLTAFTTCRGANDIRTVDPFQIRRINVGRRATIAKIQTQLLLRHRWINSLFKQPIGGKLR